MFVVQKLNFKDAFHYMSSGYMCAQCELCESKPNPNLVKIANIIKPLPKV